MVRLKSRYILFEVLFPPTDADEVMPCSKEQIILRHHHVSPTQISPKTLLYEIRRSLQLNFGDYGSGKANSLLQIKYFSNATSTGILRCHREDCDLMVNALSLMNKVGEVDSIIINPVKVSGTIKKVEEYSINRNKTILEILNQNQGFEMENFESLVDDENDSQLQTTT